MHISFHGGARGVSGACYLLETDKTKILIDCGLFQGSGDCDKENFEDFKFNPREIDALVITHSHIDHIGRIPLLVKRGFGGKIYSTVVTKELSFLALEDALSLSFKDDCSLYEAADLEKAKTLWEDASYYKDFIIGDTKIRFLNAGHILGSSMVEIWAEEKHLLFSGDLGNSPSVLLPPHDASKDVEYLVIESAYGNKIHEGAEEREIKLERAVEDVAARGGTIMIPAFATERTQEVLFYLNDMLLHKRIPSIPIFVDSPLAIKVTSVFEQHPDYYKEEIKELYKQHPNLFKSKTLHFTQTVDESKSINDVHPPKVIIAGSGMMNGGRILHHARRYISDSKSIILFVGYQSAGSLGRRLIDGEKIVRIFGEEIPARAEVRQIGGFSAHADRDQLFAFTHSFKDSLKKVFVVQGEESSALHFSQMIKDRLGIESEAPVLHQKFEI